METKGSVVQRWVTYLSWKEQTVLLCGLRGSDAGGTPEIKCLTRWIRSIVLHNAAPHKTFMKETDFTRIKDIADRSPLCFDLLPVHFFGHLLHALQVIGYRHPDTTIRARAHEGYLDLCDYLHVAPEPVEAMTRRLRDEITPA